MGLLAGLDALLVAVALLVAMLAVSAVFRPLLVSVLKDMPLVGGWLASNVDAKLADFQRTITAPADASLYLISSSLSWLSEQGRSLLGGLTDLFNAALWTSWTLATVTIPDAVGKAVQQIEALVADARAFALLQVQGLETRLGGEVARVEAEASGLVDQARSEALAGIQVVEKTVLDEVGRVERTAGGLFLQAEHEAGLLVAASESRLGELVKVARQDLEAGVAAVEHDLQKLAEAERVALKDSVSVLGGDLAAAEARANAAVAGIESKVQASIDGILQSGPWAMLIDAYGLGGQISREHVADLVSAQLKGVRDLLADTDSLRARFKPELDALAAKLKAS